MVAASCRRLVAAALVATLVAAAPVARADTALAAAKQAFAEGQAAFDAGRYRVAAERFAAAYAQQPWPALLYDIGRCHEELGDARAARASYQRYLAAVPDADNADVVRARVRALGPAYRHAAIGVGVTALALLAVGTGLVASVRPDLDDLDRRWRLAPSDALVDDAHGLEARSIAGYVTLGAAGVAAVIDVALIVRAARRARVRRADLGAVR